MEFRLLGPLEVEGDDGPLSLGGPKQRATLAHLLLRANILVQADLLIDELWLDEPPAAARNVLQTYVSRLRRALGGERLENRAGGYVLHAEPGEIDVHRFDTLVTEAGSRAKVDPAAAVDLYREADTLWRGPALGDLSDQPGLRGSITHLEERRAAALEDRIVLELGLGRHAAIIAELESEAARNPLREAVWAHLITALYRSGRQADALEAYRRAQEALDDFGLEPSSDLRQLQQKVLQQDLGLEATGTPLRGFRLLERVGEGTFGVVHRAFQPLVDREVAVKVVRPEMANDPDFIRRFEVEAQLVARLEHPHIVPLYDFWREPGGAFLVMRLLRGGSLKDALALGPFDLDAAVAVVTQIGAALVTAHRHGVVHRDVKPANILFDEDRNAYLTDFGIARDTTSIRDSGPRARSNTSSSYYLSPEERRGEPPGSWSDVYSLGLVLFEMLAGRHPFADVAPEDRGKRRVPALAGFRTGIPAGVEDVVRRATREAPEDRYADAAAMVLALTEVVESSPRTVPELEEPVRNPFKGLRPFLEPDAQDFQGREALVERLLGRLRSSQDSRLLALVGPSGSGKSSAVRAGLIPAVRGGGLPDSAHWFIAEMVPGADPFDELLAALHRLAPEPPPADIRHRMESGDRGFVEAIEWALPSGTTLLLVIDQFEELFTLVGDEGCRTAFLAGLRKAATDPGGRVYVVLTCRADFFDRPLAHADVAVLLREGTELVVPLAAEELERAISVPAARVGVSLEPGLVAQLVSDVFGRPGALPLLQFTLAELFDRRDGQVLSLASYAGIGGVAGAVAGAAEAIYCELPARGQRAAKQLFLRLTELGANGEITRRRALRSELRSLTATADEMETVVEAFARRRLLSFDHDEDSRAPQVELAHEALIHAWARLRNWIETARDDLRMQRQLAMAARDWHESGSDPSFLAGGARLQQLAEWHESSELALTPGEQEFLDSSLAERDRLDAEARERETRERELEHRSRRRLRLLIAVLTVGVVVAAGLTAYAFGQRSDAENERQVAEVRELAAAADANLEVDAERSILLALEAVDRAKDVDAVLDDAEEALHRAVIASRIRARFTGLGGALDWSPNGSWFVTEGPEDSGLIDIRDSATGESVRSFRGHEADVNLVAFSDDGSRLATSGDDGAVKVWDPATGREIRSFDAKGGPVWGVSFSPDGSRVAAISWEAGTVSVWHVDSGRLVSQVRSIDASFVTAFSPDGRRLAITTFDRGAVVVDARTGEELMTLEGQMFGVRDVDWSPDGRWIATSSPDTTVRIWSARTGQSRFTLFGHTGEVVAADWSPDSGRLVTGGDDGTARVWEISELGTRELLSLSAHERGGGLWVAFSPDGQQVMTGDQQMTAVKVWDVGPSGGAEWANVPIDSRTVTGVAFTNDGTGLIASDPNGVLGVWNTDTGERLPTPGGAAVRRQSPPYTIAVNKDGMAAAMSADGVRMWDPTRVGEVLSVPMTADHMASGPLDLAWSADGSLLAAGTAHGLVRIVDGAGKLVTSLPHDADRIASLAFSPDGRTLASARVPDNFRGPDYRGVTLWNWRDGTTALTLPGDAESVSFSPDSKWLATAPRVGPVQLWDVASGKKHVRLVGHTGAVNDVVFSPDGSMVATGSTDATVRLWDPRTGEQLLVLRGHDTVVWDLAFSPDGSRLASASPDGLARVWALDLDDLVTVARRNLTRGLTDEECLRYLHTSTCQEG